jgi:hypothetical protein
MKIGNGTQKQFFIIGRRWDPLKTVPGSCLETALKIDEKTIGKSMLFDGLKPLKSIEKQTFFFRQTCFTPKIEPSGLRGLLHFN